MRNDLELCCNCKYAEYVILEGKTKIKCTKRAKQFKNIHDRSKTPMFSCYKSLSAYACASFEDALVDSKSTKK